MPAFVLPEYVGAGLRLRPPAPVTVTEHGVIAEPVYANGPAVQVTVVVEVAWPIVKFLLSELPV